MRSWQVTLEGYRGQEFYAPYCFYVRGATEEGAAVEAVRKAQSLPEGRELRFQVKLVEWIPGS